MGSVTKWLIVQQTCQVKTSCWQNLPWYLCAAAIDNEDDAREHAAEAINKFNANEGGASQPHRMTQRFLSYDFVGDSPSDVALRPMVDALPGKVFNNLKERTLKEVGVVLVPGWVGLGPVGYFVSVN